jgi:glycosyltransferase involved in cell wall biosynthesis
MRLTRLGIRDPLRLLVVDAWLPTPDRDSASLRMFNLLQLLREFGDITFAAEDFASRRSGLNALQNLGVCVVIPPVSVKEHLERFGNVYNAIFLSRVNVAEAYLAIARQFAPQARIVFDTTDLAYIRGFRGAKVTHNKNLLRQALEIKQIELAVMRAADMTLVVSTAEQEILARDCPEARVRIVSNIHDVYHSTRTFAERHGIVFIGAFPHHPNVDAIQFFCKDILLRLRERLGDAKITVVGSQPPEWLQDMHSEHFIVAHRIPDIAPLLNECRVSMAPLRYGSGVKGKVLLSMGYGVPVVGTSIAAEGIPVMTRREMLIADDVMSFAEALNEVYRDELIWNTLAQKGKEVVAKYFSRDVARSALTSLLRELESS